MSSTRHVLRRGDDRHVRPDLVADALEPRRDLLSGQGQGRPVSRAACPFGARRRRGRAGRRAEVERARPRQPGSRAARSAAVQRSSLPPCRMPGPNRSRKRPPRPLAPRNSRARSTGRRCAASSPAERLRGRLDDPVREAAPACVEHRERRPVPVRSRDGDQHAVGPERDHRHGRLVGPQPVTGDATGSRPGRG